MDDDLDPRLRDRFDREVEHVRDPAAWRIGPRPRSWLTVGLGAVAAVLLLVSAVMVGTGQRAVRESQSSSGPSQSLPVAPLASASATLLPSHAPTPPVASASPTHSPSVPPGREENADLAVTISARGIGALTGDWAFMIRRWPEGGVCCLATGRATDVVSLVRLADSRAVDVVSFRSQLGPDGIAPTNSLAAQLSPGGRYAIISAGVSRSEGGERLALVIVDLSTGALRQLTKDPGYHDDMPAWSPDGSLIAFARYRYGASPGDADGGLWMIAPDGSGLQRLLAPLPPGGPKTFVFTWTRDSRWIGFSQGSGRYELLEPATRQRVAFDRSPAGGRDAGDWRSGSPPFVGAFSEGPRGGIYSIEVAEGPASGQRGIVSTRPASMASLFLPRWRPGVDDILYLHRPADGAAQLRVLSARGGEDRVVATVPTETLAEWTPDGRAIAFVSGTGVSVGLTLLGADGSDRRVVWSTGGAPEASATTINFGTLRF